MFPIMSMIVDSVSLEIFCDISFFLVLWSLNLIFMSWWCFRSFAMVVICSLVRPFFPIWISGLRVCACFLSLVFCLFVGVMFVVSFFLVI